LPGCIGFNKGGVGLSQGTFKALLGIRDGRETVQVPCLKEMLKVTLFTQPRQPTLREICRATKKPPTVLAE